MKALFRYFLKIGISGFGGPIALIGMMENHFVRQTKTLSDHDFRRFVAAAKLFPGPTATLIAIRIGNHLKGISGGLVAGFALIFPAFLMILVLASFFQESKNISTPLLHALLSGLNLGGLALSVIAAVMFAKPLIHAQSIFYLVASGVLTFFHPQNEILFLMSCGFLSLLHFHFKGRLLEAGSGILFLLFKESLQSSLLTFGSGIAIVPVLKAVYIDHYQWVTPSEFLTALSFGQMTPGPLVIFNAFLGHQVAGTNGAMSATLGTFTPTFVFGLFLMPLFEKKILDAPLLKAFFEGMIPAVGGAILGSVARLCLFALVPENQSVPEFQALVFAALLGVGAWKRSLHPFFILLLGALLTVAEFLFATAQ